MNARGTTLLLAAVCLALAPAAAGAASYSDLVLADNPQWYLRLNEASGTIAYDAGPNGLNGNYAQFSPPDGVPTLGVAGIPGGGAGNTAAEFHGTSPVSQVFVADATNPVAYTLEAWVKPTVGAVTNRNILLRTDGTPQTTFSHQIRTTADGHFEQYCWDGAEQRVNGTTVAQANQWYHVVGVYSPGAPGSMDLYVNGVQEAHYVGNLNAPWNGGNQWRVAAISGHGKDWFDGTMDEVAVYESALTPAQIAAHYQQGLGAYLPSRRTIIKTLDLADMVGGGDGTGTAVPAQGINPGTGALSTGNTDTITGPGYHPVTALPLIDGVFIPGNNDGTGGLMQIDSTGTSVGYPNRDGQSWDYIQNGPNTGSGSTVGGTDYNTPGHSLIGMHANKGITFDLDAIRAANPELEIGTFSTLFANPTGTTVDVNVYLDGRLMHGVGGNLSTGTPIQVGISANDRFLTLVGSDGGDSYGYDQVIFGDPKLELGRNVARGKPVTAWAYYTGANGFPPENLTDGDLNDQYPGDPQGRSFWLGPDGQIGDIVIDLEKACMIDRVDLQNTHNGAYNDRGTRDFTLLVSLDGLNWDEVLQGQLSQFISSGAIQDIPVEAFEFDAVMARYVKLQVDSFYGAGAGMNEIRVYEAVPEPITMLLLAAAATGVAGYVRRRRLA